MALISATNTADAEAQEPTSDRRPQRVWVEKTAVHGRSDRESGPYALGKAIWSPQKAKNGNDVYRFMREVRPGDTILHFTDDEAFIGISEAAGSFEPFEGLADTKWGLQPSYVVYLTNFRSLEPPLGRQALFAEEPTRTQLSSYASSGVRNLFFNKAPTLNQGAYFTPAPPALIAILNAAYERIAGRSLVEAIDNAVIPILEPEPEAVSLAKLAETTLWSIPELQEMLDGLTSLNPTRQLVLAGPPGTGKTWVARQLVKYMTGGDNTLSHLVQFHPSYTYEQFVQGLAPHVQNGIVTFKLADGLVLELARSCSNDHRNHFIIIDEMNRANLSRVFGELMFLFEYRDQRMALANARDFSLPPNLFFIGTMNTADRSIRTIDSALRRRFTIYECPPRRDILERYYASNNHINFVPDLFDGFEKLNELLSASLDRHHTIGHTFFMANSFTRESLRRTWRRQIFPIIEEYFFDRPDLATNFRFEAFWPD